MSKKIKLWLIGCLPMCGVFLLALFYMVPKHVGNLSSVMPVLQLIPVFIWGVMHPRDISFLFLALVGILVDVATSLPLGVTPLSYLVFFILVRTQRKYIYREGFATMWGYFALMLLIMQAASWGMVSFYHGHSAPLMNALLQWLFTVLAYPPLHWLFYPWVDRIGHARYRLLHA